MDLCWFARMLFPQSCHSDRETARFRRGISSLYHAIKSRSKYLLEILTSFANAHSSTVVFGFACGSSRKASIKEFHQFVSLTVTTPLRMTGLEDCNFEIYITIPLRMTGFGGIAIPLILSFRQSERSKRRGISSLCLEVKLNPKYKL